MMQVLIAVTFYLEDRDVGVKVLFRILFNDIYILLPYLHDIMGLFRHNLEYFPLIPIIQISTLMTSIWATMTLLSGTLLKILEPLRRLVSWFFPVDTHPVRALGVVAGALVWCGAMLATLI